MSRNATAAVIAAIESGMVRPAFFVAATFTSGPAYLWSGLGSITWNGHTWTGLGSFADISTVEEGSSVEAKGCTLSLSGIDATLLTDVMTEFQVGLPVTVWIGFFDADGALIPDPLISFAGRMDQPTITVDGTSATISINCESRLLEMNIAVDRRYTNEDQKLDHPTDRGMEFVNSLQEIQIFWGRLPSGKNNL